jgi:shikimate dehydrogenase
MATPIVTRLPERRRLGSPVDAATRLFLVFGDPIGQLRSAVAWSARLARRGVNAMFLPAHADSEHLAAAVEGAKRLRNLGGLMFTVPHMVAAVAHADQLTDRARRVGAIDLLRREADGRWTGDNVHGAGFVAGLRAAGIRLDGVAAYVHGCSGLGQSIAWSLAAAPISALTVFDVHAARAARLARAIERQCALAVQTGSPDWARCGLAVNASPLGSRRADPLPFDVGRLARGAVVADMVMQPMSTPLLRAAERRGLEAHHGRHTMDFALPLAAAFYGLPDHVNGNGA